MAHTDKAQADNMPNAANLAFVEGLYEDYLNDAESVPPEWRSYFQREMGNLRAATGPSFEPRSLFNPPSPVAANGHAVNGHAVNGHATHAPSNGASVVADGYSAPPSSSPNSVGPPSIPLDLSSSPDLRQPPVGSLRPRAKAFDIAIRQDRVDQLVRAFRVRGHMQAKIDPLELPREEPPELDPKYYGLTEEDLDASFSSRTIFGTERLTLRQIIERLANTYCRSIGVEFMHIHDIESKNWLQERMEGTENRMVIEPARQRQIYTMLTDATVLEQFIQKKFLGAKSFSLEGSESLIPLIYQAIERASDHGVDEVTLGMAHRGRLNVLANIMGKSPRLIFREFQDDDPQLYRGRGDVKYHMGYSSDFQASNGKNVHLSLCFNPSHLEFVNTVVQGRVRAKQDRAENYYRDGKMAILVHGDAAFAGQGIVQETLNMSQLDGYHIGGTVHVIVNNQIGFTTSPHQSRSTTYCTDVAKMLQSPIFHVNGEDPEAVAQVIQMAMDFRARFKRDVVIDMYGYRRHGHNETDEPSFTQPLMYAAISKRKTVHEAYLEHLLSHGGFTQEEADAIQIERKASLEKELNEARQKDFQPTENWLGGYWQGFVGGNEADIEDVSTGIDKAELARLLTATTLVPEGFSLHPKIKRLLQQRRDMADGKRPLDWGAAEMSAIATVLTSGAPIRMSGQDVERGTFSHRHAKVHDIKTGDLYCASEHLSRSQGRFEISNSPLTEVGVLGFEWGYSLDCPEGLVMWEAQFGDFCNVAQVIIDQFISSAEDKWKRLSGLVMLLPHGFEGMGPEHSSARLERFLLLAAEDNIQIVQPTSPSQIYHVLVRQVKRRWRKPLVIFSPKSLLRHPKAVSSIDEIASGRFRRVMPDSLSERSVPVSKVLLCSGKLYYELDKYRQEQGRQDVAILRVEQLYPFPKGSLASALEPYDMSVPVVYVQEEPENMGAWRYMRTTLGERVFGKHRLLGVSRDASSSPATGSARSHKIEQQELIDAAFAVA